MTCDPYWSSVQLLVDCNGTNGSTTFTDLSQNALTLTAGAGATVATANPKFGTGSLVSTGVPGSFVTSTGMPDPSAGPWTIELWFRSTFGYDEQIISFDSNKFIAGLQEDGQLYASFTAINGTGLSTTSAGSYATGAWHSAAWVFDGTYLYQYVDGVLDGKSAALAHPLKTWDGTLQLGGGSLTMNSSTSVDEIRFSTMARYTGNYTPATAEFPTMACTYNTPVLSGSIPNLISAPLTGVLTWTVSNNGMVDATGYDIYRNGVSLATVGAVLTYTDTVPAVGTYAYNVAAYVGGVDVTPLSNEVDLTYNEDFVLGIPNCIFDEAIYGGYFGGQLNLVEFTYMPGRTPFEEGATNLIINRYKQEPTDSRQRGVDFTQFVVPGELLQTVAVTGISAQGVPQANTSPLVTPLVIANVIIDPVTQLKFGYTVSGGQNGIEYTVQFTTTTNIQTETLEEIFSINIMIEDSFP